MWKTFGKPAIVFESRDKFNHALNDIYVHPGVTAHQFTKLAASCLVARFGSYPSAKRDGARRMCGTGVTFIYSNLNTNFLFPDQSASFPFL